MEGHGCDCGLRFCLAHASRVKNKGKHWVDQEVVPARQAEPLDAAVAREAGATPLDLPPREANPLRRIPTPTTGAVPQRPPTELILCQYTEHQDPKKCNNLSKVECPLHRPGDGILCGCGFQFCPSHAEHVECMGVHEGQRRSGAPPPRRWSLRNCYGSRSWH